MGQRVRVQGEGTEPRRYTADIPDPAESRRGESRRGGDGGGRRTETAQSEERVGSGCGTGRAVLSLPPALSSCTRRRRRRRHLIPVADALDSGGRGSALNSSVTPVSTHPPVRLTL